MADGIRCFLLERINERTWTEPCDDEDCEEDSHEQYRFDARRVDTGEVVGTDLLWMGEAQLQPGAMWWATSIEKSRPTHPRDWSDRTPDDIARLTRDFAEHPEWFPLGADPDTGIPFRSPSHQFEDGPQLYVQTPGGPWNIDSRASNCGRPYDYTHRCWIRHGEPPDVTVDKAGDTCPAGGGSIATGGYHGFLRGGYLTT